MSERALVGGSNIIVSVGGVNRKRGDPFDGRSQNSNVSVWCGRVQDNHRQWAWPTGPQNCYSRRDQSDGARQESWVWAGLKVRCMAAFQQSDIPVPHLGKANTISSRLSFPGLVWEWVRAENKREDAADPRGQLLRLCPSNRFLRPAAEGRRDGVDAEWRTDQTPSPPRAPHACDLSVTSPGFPWTR